MADVIFDSDQLQVLCHRAESRYALITFGQAEHFADGDRFNAKSLVEKAGIFTVGVMTKTSNWYPGAEMAKIAAPVREVLDRFDDVLTYGSSMGGYAALKFAGLLGATHALAFSPQFTIEPERVPFDPRWSGFYRSDWHDRSQIGRTDVARHSYMVFDPYFPYDRGHADLIARHAGVEAVRVPYSEHLPILLTEGTQTTLGLFDACLGADTAALVDRIRTAKKTSLQRARLLAIAAIPKRPRWARALYDHMDPNASAFDKSGFYYEVARFAFYKRDFDYAARTIEEAIRLRAGDTGFEALRRTIEDARGPA